MVVRRGKVNKLSWTSIIEQNEDETKLRERKRTKTQVMIPIENQAQLGL